MTDFEKNYVLVLNYVPVAFLITELFKKACVLLMTVVLLMIKKV
jgi:hypothetical protein